jgi:iron complex outermembrane receptor protein
MKKSRTTLTHLPLCLGLIAIGAAPVIQAGETVPATASPSKQQRFNIRPQPLYSALSALASQTGVQFAYAAALVKGLTSKGVRTTFNRASNAANPRRFRDHFSV